METTMKTLTGNTVEFVKELPTDLTAVLEERRVVELALEAVAIVASGEAAFSRQRFGPFRPEMLLTLLTYCYCTSTYGSEDVEWAAENEATPKYLCARTGPDRVIVRQFRRANRRWIEQCLVHVFQRAIAKRLGEDCAADDACGWARRKVDLAVLMDTAAND